MLENQYEAIVIGSGFGGSIAAYRLAKKGIKTLVLERGKWWPITDQQDTFCTYRQPDGRAAWLNNKTILFDPKPIDRYVGLLERHTEDGITVWCAAGVGGGSLVYNTVLYQPSRANWERVFPPEISYSEMDDVYYPRVREILKPSPIPGDILESDYYLSTRIMTEQAALAGMKVRRADLGSDWDVVRQELQGEKAASAIAGEIWYGINSGVKHSLDRNYLALAQDTGKVDILALHLVTEIGEAGKNCYQVTCNRINEQGEVQEIKKFTTGRLFLAAGSMGTSKMLVRAKATGQLPYLNDYIGQFWGNNGDTFATRKVSTRTNCGQGGPASIIIEHHDNPILPQALIVFPEWDAPEGTLTTLGMTLPADLGAFHYDPVTDQARLTFRLDSPGNQKMLEAVNLTYALLDDNNPYEMPVKGSLNFTGHYFCPTNGFPEPSDQSVTHDKTQAGAGVTAHPCGGVVLGKACDMYGRVQGYQGLYVVDAALIPGCTAATNPALTIAALAERCMEDIVAKDFG
ncbi:MAG: GMC oxidoreductase [Candidatus Competibacter denitrificans]